MKKRVKLFTTIASLCLAVALMAFGVYAATTHTFGVTSTVNFTVGDNIAGLLTVAQYTGNETQTTDNQGQSGSKTITASDGYEDEPLLLTGNAPTLSATDKYLSYTVSFANSITGDKNEPTITISNITVKMPGAATGEEITASDTNWTIPTAGLSGTESVTFTLTYVGGVDDFEGCEVTFDIELKYTPASQPADPGEDPESGTEGSEDDPEG